MTKSRLDLDHDPLIEKLKEDLKDENRGAVISALRLYSPLNLKGLSKLLSKAESTLHPHVKRLRDEQIVEIDKSYSKDHPGKYYQLHGMIEKYFDLRYETALDEFEDEIDSFLDTLRKTQGDDQEEKQKAIKELASYLREDLADFQDSSSSVEASFTVNKSIQSIIYQNTRKKLDIDKLTDEELVERIQEPGILGAFNQIIKTFKIVDLDDVVKITRIIVSALREIDGITKEIEDKIEKEDIPEDEIGELYFYLFTGPLATEIED